MVNQNNNMNKITMLLIVIVMTFLITSCSNKNETNIDEEFDESVFVVDIPELDNLHESVFLLWHDAYPNKNYDIIKEMLPSLDVSISNLQQVELPEILHSKKEEWDNELTKIDSNMKLLHVAVEQNDEESMLKGVESFHNSYEKLVSIIRPKLPELESFHQEMYKIYHYFMPNENVKEIQELIPVLKTKVELLKQAQLSYRYNDRQDQYNKAVSELEVSINTLELSVNSNDIETLKLDVENLHTAYQTVEHTFE